SRSAGGAEGSTTAPPAAEPGAVAGEATVASVSAPATPAVDSDRIVEGGHVETVSGRDVRFVDASAGSVEAETVEVVRGGVERASAGEVQVRQGGIGRADADEIEVTQGGIGLARARELEIEWGALGAGLADRVTIHQGFGRLVVGREVRLDRALARTIVGWRVTMGDRSLALLVVAGRVDGTVRTLLDWRGALALGSLLVLAGALLRRRR
ncbi:MAG TPA: hypothetical protein VNJ28_03950, partial [Candidatus Limnocylindrales bacterium]|nr:hypothetical protein [Candidatus Limnocylindrales bacterium]